jgi:branched-chain amino acid transport system permease protein
MMTRKSSFSVMLIFLVGALLPLVLRRYQLNMLTEIIIFALYAVSYNILLGYAGLLSFGHAMFFGLGAFITAISILHISHLSLWSCLLIAVGTTTLVGVAIGSLLLRLKGAYFALLTLAFNSLFYAVATKWHSVTGGDDGLSIKRPVVNLGFALLKINTVTAFYDLTFIIIGLVIVFCWYFTHTAMGQTVILMRENEDRMKFLGYDTSLSRLILFTFTGAIAGLAGAFYTLHFQFVSVSAISLDMATTVLLITFVGGTGTFWGPILGSFVYIILQNYLSDITDRWPVFMGLIFILMVLFIPGGLSKMILTAKDRLWGRQEESNVIEGENA